MGFEVWVVLAVLWLLILGIGGIVNDLLRGTPLRSRAERPNNRVPAGERRVLGDDWTVAARDWFYRRESRERRATRVR